MRWVTAKAKAAAVVRVQAGDGGGQGDEQATASSTTLPATGVPAGVLTIGAVVVLLSGTSIYPVARCRSTRFTS